MSSTSGPRRRRIAGERKPGRPSTTAPVPASEPPAAPARERSGDTVTAPAPVSTQQSAPAGPGRPATPAGTGTTPSSEQGPRRPVPPRLMAGVVAAATALLLVAGVLALVLDGAGYGDWKRLQQQDQMQAAIRTAPAAAERAAETILAYDHQSLEADRDAAAALMTEQYRAEYLETFNELVLEPAQERKAQVEADVRASGVAAAGPDRVEVLLFVNQTTVSTANSGEPQTALNRVVLAMERVGDAWRVDDITSY